MIGPLLSRLRSGAFAPACGRRLRRLLLLVAQFLLETLDFRFLLRQRGHQALQRLPVDLGAGLLRAEHRVAECLGGLVRELARTKRLEARLAFVEGALRGLTRAVQLGLQLVPNGQVDPPVPV